MDPFNKSFFDSSGFLSAYLCSMSCIVFNDQVGGHCCWLNDGNWWIFCRLFLLLNKTIKQSMEGFLGWVMGMVANLPDWFVGAWSLVADEAGSPLKVIRFVLVLKQFILICGGSGVVPLHLAEK
jgi:hypothetical protein